MSRRDDELDELERHLRPDDPHIEAPDKKVISDGSICWRDKDRVCGGDCVAFNFVGYGLGPDDSQQAHQQCMLIMLRVPQKPGLSPAELHAKKLREDQIQAETLGKGRIVP